jgi:hypothetical protein
MQLVQVARRHVQQMQPPHLANTAWALAKMGHEDAVFVGELVQAAASQRGRFNPQDLANTGQARRQGRHAAHDHLMTD